MFATWFYRFLADTVLVAHLAIVLFVVGGLAAILIGNRFAWAWVNGFRFRLAHLACILIVVAESWLGLTCPLTTLEASLRRLGGASSHPDGFVQYWVQRFLFFDAPAEVFAFAYTVFGLLVVGAWVFCPPKLKRSRKELTRT